MRLPLSIVRWLLLSLIWLGLIAPVEATVPVSAPLGSTLDLYTGQQFDPDLGLYYLRARYHNPDSGRFWTADAFEGFASDPASLHRYTFNHNDPVNRVDPSGDVSLGEQLTVTGLAPMVSKALYASLAYVFTPDFSEHVFSLETVMSMTSSDKAAMVGLGAIYLGSQLMGPGAYERFGAMATGVGALRKGSATYPQLIAAYQRAYGPASRVAVNNGRLYSTIGGKSLDPALFNRIQTAFQRTPGRIMASNPASELHLGPNRLIEGETLSQNVIALRMNPSTSSVYEELIHTAQLRRGMTDVFQMEIEAAKKLIRFADRYKIPASETAATIERLRILQGGAR